MPTIYFEHCRCPYCKTKLDQITEQTPACPSCNQPLDPQKVWATRSYPGFLILPRWVSAFTWPLLLILLGIALIAAKSAGYPLPSRLVFLPLGVGIVYFFIKLSGADD